MATWSSSSVKKDHIDFDNYKEQMSEDMQTLLDALPATVSPFCVKTPCYGLFAAGFNANWIAENYAIDALYTEDEPSGYPIKRWNPETHKTETHKGIPYWRHSGDWTWKAHRCGNIEEVRDVFNGTEVMAEDYQKYLAKLVALEPITTSYDKLTLQYLIFYPTTA